jgi:hypothetical protein
MHSDLGIHSTSWPVVAYGALNKCSTWPKGGNAGPNQASTYMIVIHEFRSPTDVNFSSGKKARDEGWGVGGVQLVPGRLGAWVPARDTPRGRATAPYLRTLSWTQSNLSLPQTTRRRPVMAYSCGIWDFLAVRPAVKYHFRAGGSGYFWHHSQLQLGPSGPQDAYQAWAIRLFHISSRRVPGRLQLMVFLVLTNSLSTSNLQHG